MRPQHDDMLIVRVRPATKDAGLDVLERLERSGTVRYALPLGTKARKRLPRFGRKGNVKAAVRAAAHEHHPRHAHTGSVIVHFTDKSRRDAAFAALRRHPLVESVSAVPARWVWAGAAERRIMDMLPVMRNWNHAAIRLDEARRLRRFREPRGIRVAVIDSGVDLRHPDLRGRVKRYVTSYGNRHPHAVSDRDIAGHGTHVTGIIGAARNAFGVSGICTCDLRVFKVFRDEAEFVSADGARMFLVDPVRYRWALADCLHERGGTNVINLSLGGTDAPDPTEAALYQKLLASGVVIVAAMGNAIAQRDEKSYPAAVPGVIAIAAIGPNDSEATFSRRGSHVAICAPGVSVWSTLPTYPGEVGFLAPPRPSPAKRRAQSRGEPMRRNARYDAWPGTSMAAPHVTAAVAMLLARRGPMSAAKVKARLMRTADKVPGMRGRTFSTTFGAGRLNLERLLS